LGDDVPAGYVDQMIEECDLTKNRKISYDEFLSLWDDCAEEKQITTIRNIKGKASETDLLSQPSSTSDGGEEAVTDRQFVEQIISQRDECS